MAGGNLAGGFGGSTRINEILGDAPVDQKHFLARNALAIERSAELQRVIDVIGDGDVFSEDLLANAVIETGTLVGYGGSSEIIKEEAYEIEDGGRLENHGVATRRQLARIGGAMCF